MFNCLVDSGDSSRICNQRFDATGGNTSTISKHLKTKHGLKPDKKLVQTNLSFENMANFPKPKTFRQSYAELVAKQYLPFSLIEEEVLQNAFLAFHREWIKNNAQPNFVTDKTIAGDIEIMAVKYVAEMRTRFQSKLSLTMDAWTGPNKMSFLGLTFTYLDENFRIQRGLLDIVRLNGKHSGEKMALLFRQTLSLYGIDKKMVGGVTQDNAANCGSCIEALVIGYDFDREIFYGCFLHILNLACQAAIKVYDPKTITAPARRTVTPINNEESETEGDRESEFDDIDLYTEEIKDIDSKSKAILNVIYF